MVPQPEQHGSRTKGGENAYYDDEDYLDEDGWDSASSCSSFFLGSDVAASRPWPDVFAEGTEVSATPRSNSCDLTPAVCSTSSPQATTLQEASSSASVARTEETPAMLSAMRADTTIESIGNGSSSSSSGASAQQAHKMFLHVKDGSMKVASTPAPPASGLAAPAGSSNEHTPAPCSSSGGDARACNGGRRVPSGQRR
eukprot:TRINITY_DN13079_c0_g1_i1.p2 TRINITY_DN13079_c0_g1~~TRINITY_DN13079_c0_g1_i1.p2  ORF type:complete len:198 (+),score=58.27 TRINITY_DN13079_c0_g1_i1:112-705(+)